MNNESAIDVDSQLYKFIEEIVEKNFKEVTLDVFYLITENKDISRKEIQQALYQADGNEGVVPSQSYRFVVENCISKLKGALLIDSYIETTKGAPERYFLTNYGEIAKDILAMILDNKPNLLKGTKLLK